MTPRGERQNSYSKLLKIEPRPAANDTRARLAERDIRLAADHRTEAERLLGDPEPNRSALAQRRSSKASGES
jgi:hypothetical protein